MLHGFCPLCIVSSCWQELGFTWLVLSGATRYCSGTDSPSIFAHPEKLILKAVTVQFIFYVLQQSNKFSQTLQRNVAFGVPAMLSVIHLDLGCSSLSCLLELSLLDFDFSSLVVSSFLLHISIYIYSVNVFYRAHYQIILLLGLRLFLSCYKWFLDMLIF